MIQNIVQIARLRRARKPAVRTAEKPWVNTAYHIRKLIKNLKIIFGHLLFLLLRAVQGNTGISWLVWISFRFPIIDLPFVLSMSHVRLQTAEYKRDSEPSGSESVVDDTRLEAVAFLTSSGCATSCSNERFNKKCR